MGYEARFEFRITCKAVPVQIQGTIDGHPFYYRARHGHWRLHAWDVDQGHPKVTDDVEGWKRYNARFMESIVAEGDLDGGEWDDGTIPDAFARIAENMHKITPGRH